MTQTVQWNGQSVQRRVVQSAGLYFAAGLWIGGNYWYAGLAVCGELFNVQSLALYCAARLLIGGEY